MLNPHPGTSCVETLAGTQEQLFRVSLLLLCCSTLFLLTSLKSSMCWNTE